MRKSGTPLTAGTLGQLLKHIVSARWGDFVDEKQAIELAGDAARVHSILQGAFGRASAGSFDWLEKLIAAESAAHQAFFGRTFDLTLFRQTLEHHGEEQICEWLKLKLEPHYLPEEVFTSDSAFPGWKIKPNDWYWKQLIAGKLKRIDAGGRLQVVEQAQLEGIVALIDTRLKPRYHQDGKQMFADDKRFMGSIIEDLRRDGKISRYEYGPQASRFGIAADEWQEHVRPKVAEKLKLEPNQVRLELAIEANVIPQLYQMPRVKDGTTNTWVWYEEYFEDLAYRLFGGGSGCGGLSFVCFSGSGDHWDYGAVRPLGVLAAVPLPSGA